MTNTLIYLDGGWGWGSLQDSKSGLARLQGKVHVPQVGTSSLCLAGLLLWVQGGGGEGEAEGASFHCPVA